MSDELNNRRYRAMLLASAECIDQLTGIIREMTTINDTWRCTRVQGEKGSICKISGTVIQDDYLGKHDYVCNECNKTYFECNDCWANRNESWMGSDYTSKCRLCGDGLIVCRDCINKSYGRNMDNARNKYACALCEGPSCANHRVASACVVCQDHVLICANTLFHEEGDEILCTVCRSGVD
jgi:hypothetical protein